ncbi:MAG: ribonuclease, partial [Mycobacterium sp.]|nr:ribonuclease [Mycobacterium sp.]
MSGSREALIVALGVELPDELLTLALTHRSYAYEHGGLPTNERLEFLGDAVLGLTITDELFHRHPDRPEGDLAKLRASIVNTQALADVARTLTDSGLGVYLLLGRGEENTG